MAGPRSLASAAPSAPAWRWGSEEDRWQAGASLEESLDDADLSPLHAKVLSYLGEDPTSFGVPHSDRSVLGNSMVEDLPKSLDAGLVAAAAQTEGLPISSRREAPGTSVRSFSPIRPGILLSDSPVVRKLQEKAERGAGRRGDREARSLEDPRRGSSPSLCEDALGDVPVRDGGWLDTSPLGDTLRSCFSGGAVGSRASAEDTTPSADDAEPVELRTIRRPPPPSGAGAGAASDDEASPASASAPGRTEPSTSRCQRGQSPDGCSGPTRQSRRGAEQVSAVQLNASATLRSCLAASFAPASRAGDSDNAPMELQTMVPQKLRAGFNLPEAVSSAMADPSPPAPAVPTPAPPQAEVMQVQEPDDQVLYRSWQSAAGGDRLTPAALAGGFTPPLPPVGPRAAGDAEPARASYASAAEDRWHPQSTGDRGRPVSAASARGRTAMAAVEAEVDTPWAADLSSLEIRHAGHAFGSSYRSNVLQESPARASRSAGMAWGDPDEATPPGPTAASSSSPVRAGAAGRLPGGTGASQDTSAPSAITTPAASPWPSTRVGAAGPPGFTYSADAGGPQASSAGWVDPDSQGSSPTAEGGGHGQGHGAAMGFGGAPALSPEDEALMGQRRRGGVEVVVESPASAEGRLQRFQERQRGGPRSFSAPRRPPISPPSIGAPFSGALPASLGQFSAELLGSNPATPGAASSVAPSCAGSSRTPAGRPPRGPPPMPGDVEGGRSGVRPPSAVRRPSVSSSSVPGHGGVARRSCSAGPTAGRRGTAGVQSNRKLVRNALEKYCLKGDANRSQREQVLRSFDEELRGYERFVILFRSIHTGRHDLRALYGYQEGLWIRVLQSLPSPPVLEERMVAMCLRYDSGGKEFKEVPALQEVLNVADAVFLHPQYLQKSRVVVQP